MFTKQHYEKIASIISTEDLEPGQRLGLAKAFADAFGPLNKAFDRHRFLIACQSGEPVSTHSDTTDTKITFVEWDLDPDAGDPPPPFVEIPNGVLELEPDGDDPVSEWLSEVYGFCVNDWKIMDPAGVSRLLARR